MEGVVDVPHGAWYNPDQNGTDLGACPNVLTKETHSPAGSYTYNSCLVQVKKA
jgi:anaerobic dimethyl sulfoxide reductase subunit A